MSSYIFDRWILVNYKKTTIFAILSLKIVYYLNNPKRFQIILIQSLKKSAFET